MAAGAFQAEASAQAVPREGFWFALGGGAGRAEVTCDDCDDEGGETGGSGYVKAGWTLNPRVLVGGELNVWTRREDLGDTDAWLTMYKRLGDGHVLSISNRRSVREGRRRRGLSRHRRAGRARLEHHHRSG